MHDPQFASSIMGESYIEMTKSNIESGDPMAVYKSSNQLDMFLSITVNNIMVAFRTYVFGVFLSLGTIIILLYNGIMVGCFQYFFIERGLFVESALSIWLHGTLEISSIILAGGAGLVLGSGLLFPGTFSRLQAFQRSAIRSLKLMLGITPIFVIAGLIESFLTRYTDVADALKLFFILLSGAFIIGYFVLYPWMKARKGFDEALEEAQLPPTSNEPVLYDRIKNSAEILKDSFVLYRKTSGKLIGIIAVVTFFLCLIEQVMSISRADMFFPYEWHKSVIATLFHGVKTPEPFSIALNAIALSVVICAMNIIIHRDATKEGAKRYNLRAFLQTVLVTFVFFSILHFLDTVGVLIAFGTFLLFLLIVSVQHLEKINVFSAVARALYLTGQGFGQFFSLNIILLLLLFSFLLILSAPVLYFNMTILSWNFGQDDKWAKPLIQFIQSFIKTFGFYLTVPILAASSSLFLYSMKEITSAEYLKNAIMTIGNAVTRKDQA